MSANPKKTTSANFPAGANISTLLVDANSRRVAFVIWNNRTNSIYVSPAPTSVQSTCAWIIGTFQGREWLNFDYKGPISVSSNAGSGTVTIWEFEVE
jgi:hypothetical protein